MDHILLDRMDIEFELNNLKHNFESFKSTSSSKHSNLKQKIDELTSVVHAQASHFNLIKTCLDVYIDTMKQLKIEYKLLNEKTTHLLNQINDCKTEIEIRSPDQVMISTFQELQVLNSKRIKEVELKLQTLEAELSRLNSPISIAQFDFQSLASPQSSSNTCFDGMSPLIL